MNFYIIFIFAITFTRSFSCPSENIDEVGKFVKHLESKRHGLKDWTLYYLKSLKTEIKPHKGIDERLDYIDCDTCKLAIPAIKAAALLNITEPIIQFAIGMCVETGIIPVDACDQLIRGFANPVVHIVKSRPLMTANDICGILEPGCAPVHPRYTSWKININEDKPPVVEQPPLPENVESIKIIQFTDIHMDLDYIEGSNANCGSSQGCCRDGEPESEADRAGKYGHGNCAMPPGGLDAMFEHAANIHSDAKYIFLTGDFIHSVIWLYSVEENTRHHVHAFDRLKHYFPSVPIIPVVGNHEPDVVNLFSPPETWDQGFDLSWLYNLIDDQFPTLIPEDEKEHFLQYGYFQYSPEPGVRFIIINSNLAYVNNYWLAYYTNDTFGELQWLSDTLQDAEDSNENVLIIGHASPGSGAYWPKWSDEFDRIINRYEGIIKGQFYGHGHDDEFRLHFEDESQRATGVQYISPSGTPDRGGYAYKTYFVDGARDDATWEIIDHDEWVMDLASSNKLEQANWTRLYLASEFFGMKSQRPQDVYDFVLRMIDDHELFTKYQWTYSKGGRDHYRECAETNKQCKINYLCNAVRGDSANEFNCEIIKNIFDPPLESTSSTTIIISTISESTSTVIPTTKTTEEIITSSSTFIPTTSSEPTTENKSTESSTQENKGMSTIVNINLTLLIATVFIYFVHNIH